MCCNLMYIKFRRIDHNVFYQCLSESRIFEPKDKENKLWKNSLFFSVYECLNFFGQSFNYQFIGMVDKFSNQIFRKLSYVQRIPMFFVHMISRINLKREILAKCDRTIRVTF